ncbi:MAG TPA: hypothetical protein VHP56_01695 [Solirubrobacterales bacterium]|jgi:hypothetical protein|nr:hypothetical protein [Solirubrobacterales bacterium]
MDNDQTPINAREKRRQPEAVEDLKLAVRDDVLWPVQDTFLALRDAGRSTILGAAVLVLMVAVGGYALVSFDSSQPAAPTAPVAAASEPAPAAKPAVVKAAPKPAPEPTLQGAAPVFEAPKKAKQSKQDTGSNADPAASAAPVAAGNSGNAATDTISSTPAVPTADASAASTNVKGPPAGPAAIAVARKFAGAFVVYETGGTTSTIRKAFKATATPGVTKALLQRPPHQPAGVEVPKAKVLNVVPAPSHDRIYPVSVSLLRVGATSELRLELEQLKNKQWRVANVLG